MRKIHNTDVLTKAQNWKKFAELIENQFKEGGSKYALSDDKEITDWVCEIAGTDWVLGTMAKYIGRYKNYGREKDLLKIATYCYILWLKHGFHLREEHDEDVKQH